MKTQQLGDHRRWDVSQIADRNAGNENMVTSSLLILRCAPCATRRRRAPVQVNLVNHLEANPTEKRVWTAADH